MREHFDKVLNIRICKQKPPTVCWTQAIGGCATLQRILGSVIVLEKTFEPIVYKARNTTRNDSLNERF